LTVSGTLTVPGLLTGTMANRQIRLRARPQGMPTIDDFELVETPRPQIANEQFLVRNTMLSLDPYMRGRMDAGKSYAPRVELGQVMEATPSAKGC
jgi:NADPH-dependent curcumin reductase CurA